MELVGVGLVRQDRRAVEVGEGVADGFGVVQEVEHEDVVFLRVRPVQPRERLHRLDAGERLVHVHRVEQRFVVAGLELVRADEEPVRVLLDLPGDLRGRKAVQRRLGHRPAAELGFTGEGDDGPMRALALVQIVADGVEVLDRALDAVRDHHRPRPAADLVPGGDLLVEVVHHDLGLEADRVVVAFDEAPQFLSRLLDVELRVVLHCLGEPVVAGHRRVVRQHVQDEALLDRLLHGVAVEGVMADGAVGLRVGRAEDLQRLVLRGGGEREIAGVRQQPTRLHHAVDAVLEGLVFGLLAGGSEHARHGGRRSPALAGMGFINDDGEAPAALLVADLVEDDGELLDGRDDDLLARLEEPAQIAGAVGVPHGGADLGVLPDRVVDLPVEDEPVGHHDDRVEDRHLVLRQVDQLVGQPGDGVALAAARRMLDQVASARPVRSRVGQQPAHDVQLVITRPDLAPPLPARLGVLPLHHLGVVLEDVGQALARQHLAPQVGGPDARGVGRVSRAVVPAPVERQEPRRLSLEVGAEARLALVHGEVRDAAAEREQRLARVAVFHILLDRVGRCLLREAVLQLEGEDRQAVDEEAEVERSLRLVAAVAELPDDGEAVLQETFLRLGVPRRGSAVEDFQIVRAVPDAVAQHRDGAALRDLALQAGQEPPPCRAVLVERQRVGGLRLRHAQERRELDPVNAELAVVVAGVPAAPARAAVRGARFRDLPVARWIAGVAGQRRADEAFEAALRGVGGLSHLCGLRRGSPGFALASE